MSKWTKETEPQASKVAAIFVYLAALWVDAWATAGLWNWFAVPIGAPVIGKAHAAGLSMLVALLVFRNVDASTDKRPTLERACTALIVGPILMASGAIAHWLMVRP